MEFTIGIVDPVEIGLLHEALAALGEADSPLRARVLARLARALLFTPQIGRRLALSEEAAAMARRLRDPATLAAVLYDRHQAIWGPRGRRWPVSGWPWPPRWSAWPSGSAITRWRCGAGALRRADLLELGDLAGFDTELAAAERTTLELRQLRYRWQLPLTRATRSALVGRFAEAEELAVEGLAIGRRAGDQAVQLYHTGFIVGPRFMQGRVGELVDVLPDLATRFPAASWYRAAHTAALAQAGHADQARAEVQRLAADDLAAVGRDPSWMWSLGLLALACHRLDDAGLAGKLHGLLEPYADRNIASGRFVVLSIGPVGYFLGLLDLTLGQPEQAVRRFQQAAALAGRMQARPMVAMSHEGQARALLALDRPGDRERAAALLAEAATVAEALGIHGLGERASALRAAAAPAASSWPAGLTGREVEVLRLIAAGHSNRGIAEALFISPGRQQTVAPQELAMDEPVPCPQCGAPARITERFRLGSTDGPVEHVKIGCVNHHWLTPLAETLAAPRPAIIPTAAQLTHA